jgi:phytoene/squalene synthetase
VEWLCVGECLRFSLRHRRYFLIFLGLYWHSLRSWKEARAARYGFCFLQLYDDIMDGDRVVGSAPDAIAARIIAEWECDELRGDDTLARLGAAFDAALRTLPLLPGDDPRADVRALLEAMRLDARRVAARSVLPAAQIRELLRGTFHHSLNVLLIVARFRTRAAQVPDLVEAMGWCSVVRDLEEDLRKGLVNIPLDVVNRVQTSGGELTASDPQIQRWLADEKLAVRPHLERSAAALLAIVADDPGAGRLLRMLHRSVERYAR